MSGCKWIEYHSNFLVLISCSVRSKRLRGHLVLTSTRLEASPAPVIVALLPRNRSLQGSDIQTLLKQLKGVWHEIFDLRFFTRICPPPPAPRVSFRGQFEFLYEKKIRGDILNSVFYAYADHMSKKLMHLLRSTLLFLTRMLSERIMQFLTRMLRVGTSSWCVTSKKSKKTLISALFSTCFTWRLI